MEMDRLALIKSIHKKRKYVLVNPRPKMSTEERLIHRRNIERSRVQKFKDNKMCQKCGKEPIIFQKLYYGKVIWSKRTVYCPKHSKGPVSFSSLIEK